MVLNLTINHVDKCYGFLCVALTWDTKNILWIDNCIFIMA